MSLRNPNIQSRARRRRWFTSLVVIAVLAGGILIGAIAPTAIRTNVSGWNWALIAAAAASFAFGTLVGLSEILTRYRDEPLRATFNVFGWIYLGLNGVISLAAFAILRSYSSQIFPVVANDLFLTAVTAGFGAMIVMRSKLFSYNSPEGKEFAVGPAIVIDTVLQTIDAKIDRFRATQRQERVYEQLHEVSDFEGAAQYLEASLLSFQTLSDEQKSDISSIISDYREIDWDDRLKVMAVGFAFLTIAGEDNFDQVVANMKKFLTPAAPKTLPSTD
jgi:hypothetical protein